MKVSIGFSKHKTGFLSPLICAAQNANYSHVYIRRDSKYGEYVYQASGLQVNFTNIETFLDSNIIVEEYEFDVQENQHDELLKLCIKYAGRPYGITALFKSAARLLLKRLGLKDNLMGDGDKTFVCSELGALICENILNIDIPEDTDFIAPVDLNPYVSKYGKRVI